ncbi:Na+/H+ antiporter NhaC family protein [Psychrosphaera haliotis]|uniref:Na+/H+ antiporter NhaC family protein n=1 Tax=Psychrosphaera haliotis TaxID=555083 RepID=A0A6N8F7G0_9GAMM|nr:Na+/H+ antiporter NhaC family protein [Psychrosphaera haliotis]MUH72323.1 Na+/H+ antiporter NhaC family protein [Psychrosphaera haliotis]
MTEMQKSGWALLPLGLFILLFLGTGIYLQSIGVEYAFYQLPAPVAIIPALLLALYLNRVLLPSRPNLDDSLSVLIKGMGNNNVITMCLIYLLAGAFASVAKEAGGVSAVVNLGIGVIPSAYLVAGLFIISAIIATAMGTSMGTIGAVAPIAFGVIEVTQIDPAVMAGAIVGGAMFGDNLSFISDTTIASTKTQGAELKDKFKENLIFSVPAAMLVLAIYIFLGGDPIEAIKTNEQTSALLALPYFFIIVLAVLGLNVFLVLLLGILLSALSGVFVGTYEIASLGQDIYAGFANMQEIFLLSLLIGGLSELMKHQGGLEFLVSKINKILSKASNSALYFKNQVAIASLGLVTNSAIANNTVAIIVSGDSAKKLATQGEISAKRSASLLDIFSCITQGLVPYGAQALLAAASFGISPIDVITHVWYCVILFFVSVTVMFTRKS